MMRPSSTARLAVLLTTVGVAIGPALYALAGHEVGTVPSYTGCLNTSSGTIASVAVGSEPLAACKDKETTVHVSGGDISRVTPGAGLTGGGTQGNVDLAVDSSTIVTGVAAGFGLTGGASGGDVTLAADPAVLQRRVTTNCDAAGGSIAKINQDGTAVCRLDENLGYVATLDAGTVLAVGSTDTDLCDEGFNE